MTDNDAPVATPDRPLEGFEHDVERIEAEPWVEEVSEEVVRSSSGSTQYSMSQAVERLNVEIVDDPERIADARESIQDHLNAISAEPRYLAVDAPMEARPGQSFPVHVQLAVSPTTAAQITRPFAIPERGRVVTIDLTATANLELRTPATASVLVRRGQDSDPVRFELGGTREGKATIDVRAFADQAFIGAVRLDVTVHADARNDTQTARTSAMLAADDREGLTLEIRVDATRTWYEFQLRGRNFTELPVRAQLNEVDTIALGLQQQLNELARGTPGYSAIALRAILQGQGAAIWQLLPPAVQKKLLDNVGIAERLCIVTERDPVPWELVFAAGRGTATGFLSDLFLVTRWQYGPGAPLEIGRGDRCFVVPPGAPSAAMAEVTSVQKQIGAGVSISRVDDVLARLAQPSFGLLHIAAHSKPNFSRPNASAILLDQPFVQAMVGPDRNGTLSDCAPLVFVNACSSTTPTLAWVGTSSRASCFLAAGAGGFVGSLWEIRDSSAAAFATEFYRGIAANKPLGTAFRLARNAIKVDGDPTWLAYTLYAHPFAHFQGAARL